MKTVLYIIIFIIGVFFGSFAALAIRRIPKKRNITTKKTTCPHCNHEFNLIDSIPILSYIFSGGRCRYCKKKIKITDTLIEFVMGIVSVGIYWSNHAIWGIMSLMSLTEYIYLMIFATTMVIIAGIEKNNQKIYKPIIFIGMIIGLIHILFLYFSENASVVSLYRYFVYMLFALALVIYTGKNRYNKYNYILEVLIICIYINMFIVTESFLITSILTIIFIVVDLAFEKNRHRVDESDILAENKIKLEIPIAFWLCISSIIAILVQGIVL